MTVQPSNDVGFVPRPITPMAADPLAATPAYTAPSATAHEGRLGAPGPGAIVLFVGWAALAAAMLLLGGMVFVGILQAAG